MFILPGVTAAARRSTNNQVWSGLLAFWNFNNSFTNANGNTLYDLSFPGGNPTLPGPPAYTYNYVAGLNNNAVKFNDYGTCNSSSGLVCLNDPWDLTVAGSAASFSIWIKLYNNITFVSGCAYGIFGNFFNKFGFGIDFTTTTNTVKYSMLAATAAVTDPAGAFSLNTWYNIVGTYNTNSKNFKIYRNSTKIVDTTLGTLNAVNGYRGFGINGSSTTGLYGEYGVPIIFDSSGLWTRELTQADVDTLYNGGLGLPYN